MPDKVQNFQYIIPFLTQVWLYASPVVYSVQIVPERLRLWYYINPMVGFLDMFRFAITGITAFSWSGFGWSAMYVIAKGLQW